jgi:2-iminobutanoate/2-iminopropanoate deaminase
MPRSAPPTTGLAPPKPPFSNVVVHGDVVAVSGQGPTDEHGTKVSEDITEQTRQVLHNIRTALAAAGCTLDDVVKVTSYLADLDDFEAYNAVYREVFSVPYPARTTVGCMLIGTKVEIDCIAVRPG